MKPQLTGVIALVASAVAVAALAHSGAAGVVLARMNGMTAMRDTVAELAPMMQGSIPYDTFIVSESASVIAGHAGETMLSLFPTDSLDGVTYAKPQIWSEWQQFAALAEELKTYADALSEAAPNGLEPAPGMPGEMAVNDPSGVTTATAVEPERGFSVAELLGYEDVPDTSLVGRGTSDPGSLAPDLTTLAADDLFNRISATCLSCHSRYRVGRN